MQAKPVYELTREVMATADVFLRESTRLFRPYGVTAAQYNVLTVVAGAPAGLSQRELGDVLVVDRSNVTGLINRLEKAGWIARRDNPSDKRAYRVVLTPAGRALWEKLQPRYESVVAQVTEDLSEKQVKAALAVLKILQAGAVKWSLPEI